MAGEDQTATAAPVDDWGEAAKIAGNQAVSPTARNAAPQGGDDWDAAAAIAQRPIPQPLTLGQSKNTNAPIPINVATDPRLITALPSAITGAAKAVAQDAQTVAKHLMPSDGSSLSVPGAVRGNAPTEVTPEEANKDIFDKDVNTPEGLMEAAGAGGEGIAELITGDEALKGLTLGDKYGMVSRLHKALETAPRAQKAMELGMQAMRQSSLVGAQQYAHGASPGDALSAAGVAAILGVPVGQITHWTPELMDSIGRAQANKYVKTPADLIVRGVNPPEEVSLSGAEGEGAARDYAKFDKELKSNLPYLIGTSQETGVEPQGRRGLIDLTMKTADKFHSLYQRDILNPVQDVEVSAKPRIPNYKGAYDQDTGQATLRQLDTRLNELNDMLFKSYERGKGGLPSEAAIGESAALTAEARSIRKVLYSELQNRVGDRLGVNVAEIKTRNGQLRDMADSMERRWQQARAKAALPIGDVAHTPTQAVEQGAVRGARKLLGDPRDNDINTGWKLLRDRGDHGLPVSIQGPSVPPPTNAFAERTPTYVNIPARPTDIVWEGSTPEEIQAQKDKIAGRASVVKNAREQASKKVQANRATHGPTRGVPDATGEP